MAVKLPKLSKVTCSIPKTLNLELDALVKTGLYKSKSDLLRDAIEGILILRRDLRTAAACRLYSDGKISLGKASEIIGSDIESTKKLLVENGVKLLRGATTKSEITREMSVLEE